MGDERSEFLDLIAEVRSDSEHLSESFSKLMKGDGSSVRTRAASKHAVSRDLYERSFREALALVTDVARGRQPAHRIKEALSTSDFPLLFGDIIDRTLLGAFQTYPTTYQTWTESKVNRDFRTANIFTVEGADDDLEEVKPGTEYPETSLVEGKYTIRVAKRGRRLPLLWETTLNDDLNALTDIPVRFGRAAARSREKQCTDLWFDDSGFDASFFTVGNGNLSDDPLTVDGLNNAVKAMFNQVDAVGEPIIIAEGFNLHVPPALWLEADRLVKTVQIRITDANGDIRLITGNGVGAEITPVRNPYFASRNPDAATRDTSWGLTARGGARTAFMRATLRGHEDPEVFMKEPNARRVGGGAVNPLDGDFDTDSIAYKVRDVFGTAQIDPKFAYASTGNGS